MSQFQYCIEFMRAAGQEVKDKPGKPTADALKLRLSLELEELYEKAQAFGMEGSFQKMLLDKSQINHKWLEGPGQTQLRVGPFDTGNFNTEAVLDACADQRVVADGTILACGLQDVFPAAMDEVHRSNMSKFLDSPSEAHDEAEKLRQTGESVRVEGSALALPYRIIRRSDGKVLKPSTYSPANLAPLLEGFGSTGV
jgi:predicted HAD superfamily Cof-like phosphohydrolase